MYWTDYHIARAILVAALTILFVSSAALSQDDDEYEWLSTDGPPSGNVVSILEIESGMVLAGTERKGLFLRGAEDPHWTNVPFSDFNDDQVRALASYKDTLLAGTGRSGIYRSIDGGLSWQRFNKGLASTLIYDFLVTRRDEVYVATGRGIYRLSGPDEWIDAGGSATYDVRTIVETRDGGILIGTFNIGKLLSLNAGGSWTQVDDIGPVRSLAVGPSGEIVAGLWGLPTVQRSDDDGRSWRSASTGLAASRVWSVEVDNDGIVYAGSAGNGISISSDGGETWHVSSAPTATVTSLSVSRDGGVWGGTSLGAFRSTDNGQSWNLEGIPLGRVRGLFSNGARVVAGNDAGGLYYSDDLGVTWIRTNAETDAVYEIERKMDGALYAATRGKVYRSSDEGSTWISLWNTHLWVFSSAVDSKGTVFAGTEWGIYRQEPDSSWKLVSPPEQRVFSIAVDAEDIVFAGVEHEAMLRSVDGGTTWSQVADEFLVTNECLCSIVVLPDGQLAAAPLLAGGVRLSSDRGESWTAMGGITEEIVTDLTLGSGGEFVAGGSTGRVFMFDSATDSWQALGPNAPDKIRSISHLRSVPDTVLFVGTEENGVYTRVKKSPSLSRHAESPQNVKLFSVAVYPNPAATFAIAELTLTQPGQVVLQLVDPLGRLVRSQSFFAVAGSQKVRIDTNEIPSGLYQVRIQQGTSSTRARPIIVVH